MFKRDTYDKEVFEIFKLSCPSIAELNKIKPWITNNRNTADEAAEIICKDAGHNNPGEIQRTKKRLALYREEYESTGEITIRTDKPAKPFDKAVVDSTRKFISKSYALATAKKLGISGAQEQPSIAGIPEQHSITDAPGQNMAAQPASNAGDIAAQLTPENIKTVTSLLNTFVQLAEAVKPILSTLESFLGKQTQEAGRGSQLASEESPVIGSHTKRLAQEQNSQGRSQGQG